MSSPSGRIAVAVVMASAVVLGACRVTGPTPLAPNLLLDFEEPVIARFVSATGVFIAEFPVTVSDPPLAKLRLKPTRTRRSFASALSSCPAPRGVDIFSGP
jgi:hypothetical protein